MPRPKRRVVQFLHLPETEALYALTDRGEVYAAFFDTVGPGQSSDDPAVEAKEYPDHVYLRPVTLHWDVALPGDDDPA